MKQIFILLISLSFFFGPSVKAESVSQKPEALAYIHGFLQQNQKVLEELDQQIRKILVKSHKTNLSPKENSAQSLQDHTSQLETLTLKRREFHLRQNFFDRLKFRIDRKYKSGNFREFLSKVFLDMAYTEALEGHGDLGFTKFCNYLSVAIQQIPEKHEKALAFIEGYMKFSSILNPQPPQAYLAHRSYSNGVEVYNAQEVSREDVGEIVETRLKKLKALDSLNRLSFEKRKPILKPVQATLDLKQTPPTQQQPTEAQVDDSATQPVPTTTDPSLQLRLKMDNIHKPRGDPN